MKVTKAIWIVLLCGCLFGGPDTAAGEMAVDGQWITDAHGRRINVSAPFERIIALYGAHTENLFAMGAGEKLIGVGRNDDWPPEAREKPVHSYHDGLEKFLAARPDLVLVRPMIDRGYGRLLQQLEKHGIAVVSLQPRTVEQMYLYWTILGKLCGQTGGARQMVTRFKTVTGQISDRTGQLVNKKRVYFEAIHDRMRTFAPTAMPVFVLETAGGINVAGDAKPRRGTNIADFGKERILAIGDNIDVYLAQSGPMNRPTLKMIKQEPGYGLIRAVQENRIHIINEKLVSRPTLRLLSGICSVGRLLYPEIFSGDAETSGCTGQNRLSVCNICKKETDP